MHYVLHIIEHATSFISQQLHFTARIQFLYNLNVVRKIRLCNIISTDAFPHFTETNNKQ